MFYFIIVPRRCQLSILQPESLVLVPSGELTDVGPLLLVAATSSAALSSGLSHGGVSLRFLWKLSGLRLAPGTSLLLAASRDW